MSDKYIHIRRHMYIYIDKTISMNQSSVTSGVEL